MANISIFDGLSNEVIVCIFDYLGPSECFRLFYDLNTRLRHLVKRYVPLDSFALDKDIKRYSTLHSWYKHLSCYETGTLFHMAPFKGEQERYSFDPRISDTNGIHWHFLEGERIPMLDERVRQIVKKYPIRLNRFFHPYSAWLILNTPDGKDFIRQYYPAQFDALMLDSEDVNEYLLNEPLLKFIETSEENRMRNMIRQAAYSIWKEIQTLEDVNILNIQYET